MKYNKMIPKPYNHEEWYKLHDLANTFCGYMYKILKEREGEDFEISKRIVNKKDVKKEKMSTMFSGNLDYYDFKEGTYTRLIAKGCFSDVVMSDTPMEIRTNMDFLYQAHGNILIGGLGLGIMLKILEKMNNIKSVTVIEKNQEVIDLVLVQLNLSDNFKVIQSDIFEYEPLGKFDTIYFDIWTNICGDNWDEMKKLRKQFKKSLNLNKKDWWIGSWRQQDCKELIYNDHY